MALSVLWEPVIVSEERRCDAYMVRPSNPNGHAIVLLQEVFGVNASMRDSAEWIAKHGFVVAVPDLYWRLQPRAEIGPQEPPYRYDRESIKAAFSLLERFDEQRAISDIAATVGYIRASVSGITDIHVMGFCLGGKLAVLAAGIEDIKTAISFYGVGIENCLGALAEAKCPIQLHFGGLDKFVPPEAITTIEHASTGLAVEVFLYKDADHGFFSPGRHGYDSVAAELAFSRSCTLMERERRG